MQRNFNEDIINVVVGTKSDFRLKPFGANGLYTGTYTVSLQLPT